MHVQVLEVATGELVVGDNLNLALAGLTDGDVVAQVVGAALDLDALLEELLKGGGVEDLVARGLLGVDDELGGRSTLATPSPPLDSELLTFLVVCFWALPVFLAC